MFYFVLSLFFSILVFFFRFQSANIQKSSRSGMEPVLTFNYMNNLFLKNRGQKIYKSHHSDIAWRIPDKIKF